MTTNIESQTKYYVEFPFERYVLEITEMMHLSLEDVGRSVDCFDEEKHSVKIIEAYEKLNKGNIDQYSYLISLFDLGIELSKDITRT